MNDTLLTAAKQAHVLLMHCPLPGIEPGHPTDAERAESHRKTVAAIYAAIKTLDAAIAQQEAAPSEAKPKCRNWCIQNLTAFPKSCPTCGLSGRCTEGVPFVGFPEAKAEAAPVAPAEPKLPDTSRPDRNWTEDASHENGEYYNRCCMCHCVFIGHKRRVVCKACAAPMATFHDWITSIEKSAYSADALALEAFEAGFRAKALQQEPAPQPEPVAWRSAVQYSPDVGSWFEYYDEYRTTNDTAGLTPLFNRQAQPVTGQKPVAWLIDWPEEPELGHYFADAPTGIGRSTPLYRHAQPVRAPLSDAEIDMQLDAILRASGSALRHYTTQKTKDDMRAALQAAILAAQEAAK